MFLTTYLTSRNVVVHLSAWQTSRQSLPPFNATQRYVREAKVLIECERTDYNSISLDRSLATEPGAGSRATGVIHVQANIEKGVNP